MKNKLFTAIMLAAVLIVSVVPAFAETTRQQKLTLKWENKSPDLSVSPSEVLTISIGEAASVTVTATQGKAITWTSEGVPNWLTTASTDKTFTLTGTPSISDIGTSTVTITASNDKGKISKTVTLNVFEVEPVLTSDTFTGTAHKSVAFSLDVTASTGTNIGWELTGTLPSGLSYSSEGDTLTISGTPALGTAGTYNLTVTASNSRGSASANVTITVKGSSPSASGGGSDDVNPGTKSEPETWISEGSGASNTTTKTTFQNGGGVEIAAIDITISTASDDVTTVADEDFTQTVTVDVSGNIADPDYGEYTFAMNIDGLPEWLTADGELEYSSSELQDSGGAIDYHHEFTISGKPSEVSSTELAFTATVTLAGDSPILQTDGSKGIKITVVESVVSSDESPDIPPDASPDIPPEASPDIPPEASPDIPADASPDIPPEASPDIPPEASPDIPASESPDIPPETSPDIPAEVSPDVPPDEGATIDTTTMEAESISEILESLTPEEAASVTSLKIGNNITDLSGLEAFSNLTTLDLTEATSIKTVDLSGSTVEAVNAQGNNSIETVDVSDCENLKTLDVSNSSVTSLTAEGCSNLEEVDVSGCQNLEILDVSDTPITTLNAENCTNLEEIDCANCMLDELQIEGCNNLVKVDCRNNRLHKFDADSFNKLDELLCRNQRITGWVIGRVFSFLNYFMMNVSAADGENAVSSGIENITNVKAWDADGQEISVEFDADTGTATFGKAPAQITYDYATGFRDVLMDVTVIAAEQDTPEPEDTGRLGSPGGCNTTVFEFSGAMMVLALLLFRRKRS